MTFRWTGTALAVSAAACLMSTSAPAHAQTSQIWPPLYENQWHWHTAQSDLSPAQIDATLKAAVADEPRFETSEYFNAYFFLSRIKLAVKSKVTGLQVEGRWLARSGKGSGSKSVFVPLDPMTAATLWYLTEAGQHKWNVKVYPAPVHDFYFTTEDLARRFIDALASARTRHAPPSRWLKFGMMTQDLSPAQAEDAGRPRVDSVYAGMVAIGGPADRAGIQAYDVIVEFDNKPVVNEYEFEKLVDATAPGATVTLTVLRRTKAPEGTKVQMPEGVRYPYVWEPRTVSVVAR
jgi:hypothetical protein